MRGERNPLYCNWNLMSSSTDISCLERLNTYLHRLCARYIANLVRTSSSATYTTLSVVRTKWKLILHIIGGVFFNPLYVEAGAPCLSIPTLALYKDHVLACNTQHLFGKIRWQSRNVPMEKMQLISNFDVICVTPCFVEFKDSSIHALLAFVLRQRIKRSTFVGSMWVIIRT